MQLKFGNIQLPYSAEAEQSVLGGLMLDAEAWEKVVDRVFETDFYQKEHQLIFQSITQLIKQAKPIDILTVVEALRSNNHLAAIGGETFIFELAKNTPGAANIATYAEIIHDYALLRKLISTSNDIATDALNPYGRTVAELIDEAERKVFAIAQATPQRGGPVALQSLVKAAVAQMQERMKSGNSITGLPTGFKDLDDMTSGLQKSDLIIIAARPSMGKTTFAMNIVENAAIKCEKGVLVFSMEMPGESLATRMIASLSRVELQSIRKGRLNDQDWPRLISSQNLMHEAKVFIDDTPALTPSEVRTRARRIIREQREISLIVIDYLQLMQAPGMRENRVAEISEISRSLKSLARELNVPIIALSQLNRGLEQRQNKRPQMSDLRESGAIEQDADLILFIYRDEVYNENSEKKGRAEIIIAKQRNGPIGHIELTFLGQYTKFENYLSQRLGYGEQQ